MEPGSRAGVWRGLARAVAMGAVLAAAAPGAGAGCEGSPLPACGAPAPVTARPAPLAADLASADWRLFSPIFAAMPAGGYPIVFHARGAVDSPNLAGVASWSMPAPGQLDLLGADGGVLYAFRWSERHGAFQHRIPGGTAAGLAMVIAPAALAPLDVAAAMEERPRGEVDPALLPRLLAEPPAPPIVLRGARVATEDEASHAAVLAYFSRAGGMRALQGVGVVGAVTLGFDMAGFARTGDRVWEVRIHERGTLSGVIWVNAETGQARLIAP